LFLGVIVKVLSELELVGEEDIIIQVVKLSDETWNVPKHEVSKVLVVTELLSIVSEKVTETFDVIETEVSPSEGELDDTVGGVVSELLDVLLLLQEMKVELKRRRIERRMSICSLGFLIGYFRKTQNITLIGLFYKNWGFHLEGVWLWRISGGYSQEMNVGWILQW